MKIIIIISLFLISTSFPQGKLPLLFGDDLEPQTNTLVTNAFRWVDSNADGTADGWEKGAYSTDNTQSIVTKVLGFTGNAQKDLCVGNTRPHIQYISLGMSPENTYRISFYYYNTSVRTVQLFSSTSSTITPTATSGNLTTKNARTYFEGTFTGESGKIGFIYSGVGVAGEYLIIDEVRLTIE